MYDYDTFKKLKHSEKTEYCSKNIDTNICQRWCINHPGKCDFLINYCKTDNHKYKPICSCLNSKKHNPICQDNICIKQGYITNHMHQISKNGCKINDTSTNISIQGHDLFVKSMSIEKSPDKKIYKRLLGCVLILFLVLILYKCIKH